MDMIRKGQLSDTSKWLGLELPYSRWGHLGSFDSAATANAARPASAGFYHSKGWNKKYSRLQIFTIAQRRFGTAEEMAAAVRYLASPEAAYITGQTILVDGGLTSY